MRHITRAGFRSLCQAAVFKGWVRLEIPPTLTDGSKDTFLKQDSKAEISKLWLLKRYFTEPSLSKMQNQKGMDENNFLSPLLIRKATARSTYLLGRTSSEAGEGLDALILWKHGNKKEVNIFIVAQKQSHLSHLINWAGNLSKRPLQADKTQHCNAIKWNVWEKKPFEVSHLNCFARKCQINYFLYTWWRVMLIKGHMNNGRRCLCSGQPGTNKWRSRPAEQRLITQAKRKTERFRGKRRNTVDFFFTLLVYFFSYLLFPHLAGKRVALVPFLPLDVSINQHHHRLWVQ